MQTLKRSMQKFLSLRTSWLKLILGLAFGLIVVRLFNVQILQHQHYVEEANAQQTMQSVILAERGEIYLMDGDTPSIAVMNTRVWSVILDPQIAKYDRENIEKKITEFAADYITADWQEVFATNNLRYYVVARNVPYQIAEKIQDEDLSGVWLQSTTKRVYSEGTLASQVLGFVNADGKGQYGVEGALNTELSGKNGVLKTVKDVNNIPLTIGDQNVKVPAEDGENIVLTIDRNIQNISEKVLRQVAEELQVKNATAVVMNPQTGEVLAMASAASYDPGDYGAVEDASVFQLDATTGLFEPASVCKTFVMSAAINEGKMTPETRYTNNDMVVVDGWQIWNAYRGLTGSITMQTALSWSLNTGSIQALRLLGDSETEINMKGKTTMYDYYFNRFRLGQATGIELAEAEGIVYEPDDAPDSTYANMTFGQGLSLTPIQVAAAYSAVVNGGDYYTPTIVAGEMRDGAFIQKDIAEPDAGVISAATSKTMRQMLHVARYNYTDAAGYDQGAFVGGKTGTAQTVDAETGAYISASEGQTVGSYVGFGAKTEDDIPEYVIVVKLWEKGKTMEGGHAKMVFDRISQQMIRYLKWDVV